MAKRKSKKKTKKEFTLKFKKESDATSPEYAHKGDAGLDLYSNEKFVLKPGHRKAIKTGLYLEIPENHVGLVWDKSGLALKSGLKTMGGVIDSTYRGEVKVILVNLGKKKIRIDKGVKIAQLLIQEVKTAKLKEVKENSKTKRGKKGFGSTGLKKSDLDDVKKEIMK